MFEYELGQTIYYMRDNRTCSAPIMSRVCIENAHDDWAHTAAQQDIWQHFGPSGVMYVTCHGVVAADEAFPTKEALLEVI